MSTYINLLAQAQKLHKHNRQGSFQTKRRYFEAFQRFLRFVADEFKLQKLRNISGKHLHAYFDYLKEKGVAPATQKTDAAAIRFFHDKISDAKHKLPDNNELKLERRQHGGDRSWDDLEVKRMIAECRAANQEKWGSCIAIAHSAGLRIHELMKLDTADARRAIKTGFLDIIGKGGRPRHIPVSEAVLNEFEELLKVTNTGSKLFVPDDQPTHLAIENLRDFIRTHREKVQLPDSDANRKLDPHGLRYSYSQAEYTRLRSTGLSDREARLKISELLGHSRISAANPYLSGLKNTKSQSESDGGGDDGG